MDRIEVFKIPDLWLPEQRLEPAGVVNADDAHRAGLLHRSAHLLVLDSEGRVACRRRARDEKRYPGLWTTTLGSHVEVSESYKETLRRALASNRCRPFLGWIGEFRVADGIENEVCGLFHARINMLELPQAIRSGRAFVQRHELDNIIRETLATPHLIAALALLRRAADMGFLPRE